MCISTFKISGTTCGTLFRVPCKIDIKNEFSTFVNHQKTSFRILEP